jgi:hypothetical protein
MRFFKHLLVTVVVGAMATACAQVHKVDATATSNHFAQDRASILAMAGTYKVTFDMRETVSFSPDYALLPPKSSGGTEVVLVIEDTGKTIKLQHILVGKDKEGKEFHVKHWRQDWTYEPAQVLEYRGTGAWSLSAVSKGERAGAWSQTVWQVDDSPRYGGVGHWRYDGNVARWEAYDTLRPLPRRDATRKPKVPFDRYAGMNRHTLTPDGWVHEQDNSKITVKDGKALTIAHEVVLNTYQRRIDPLSASAEHYWAETTDFWTAVRKRWDDLAASNHGLILAEDDEYGSATAEALLTIADDIATGKTQTAAALLTALADIDAKVGKQKTTTAARTANSTRAERTALLKAHDQIQ